MSNDNIAQINLKDILQFCRTAVNELNSSSIVSALREQNERFDKALGTVERILPAAENVLEQGAADVGIKAATIFVISLWSKIRHGASVDDLSKDDWNNIIGNIYENAAVIDPQEYSLLVFDLYRRSIAFAIEPMKPNASPTAVSRLEEIVSLMEEYADELRSGAMSETKFIEENLYLSLEAVFLVMTDRMSFTLLAEERRELAVAVSALIFQKIRYSHYDKELAVVNKCLEYQGELDQRLEERVNAYIDSLKNDLDEFDALVDKAFDTSDYRIAFRGSISLAETIGADGILQTKQDIEDYFLS